ncbi:hypothetical protein N7467_000437 [Penicillium canescens]|nr:hypothetical protein N7467_000437 [Penicillium canescens]
MPPSAQQTRKRKRSPKPPTSSANPPTPSSILNHPSLRTTPTHIFFHGGILSNWHPSLSPFPGKGGLEICLPLLDELGIAHPSPKSYSTLLIHEFGFGRGEQWMMAMKAWLFECEMDESGLKPFQRAGNASDEAFKQFQRDVLSPSAPAPSSSSSGRGPGETAGLEKKHAWDSHLPCILRTNVPRSQKALGRKVRGFRPDVWNKASIPIMMAGCVARAQVDQALRSVYLAAQGRTFVEGSPRDRIWGVGLKWDSKAIEDEANWRGENRLGRCHGEAARVIQGVDRGS